MALERQISIDGLSIHVPDGDPRNAPVALLSHALMANNHMWDSTAKKLNASGYRTIRYDHVGHGQSKTPPSRKYYHFDDFTSQMREILRQTTGQDSCFAVVGCSMGGVLAYRFSMMFPELVQRVICCDPPGMTSLEVSKQRWRRRIESFKSKGVVELARETVDRWFPDPCPVGVKERALQQTLSCTYDGYLACAEGIVTYDYNKELSKVKVKSMVLVGENDEAVGPLEVLENVAKATEAAYVRRKDAGHIPPSKCP